MVFRVNGGGRRHLSLTEYKRGGGRGEGVFRILEGRMGGVG